MSKLHQIFRAFTPGATLLGVGLVCVAGSLHGAVPVEESQPSSSVWSSGAGAESGPAAANAGGSSAARQLPASAQAQGAIDSRGMADTGRLSDLFYQLQVLQQEVQQLRGQVEEQNHRLERLARDQQEQYLDLDRRMQALRGTAPMPAPTVPGPGAGAGAGAAAGAAAPAIPSSEREAYARAFDLMKQRQFEASTAAFNQLVSDYPNGAYTPNAFYWLGELYLAQDQNEQARQSFVQVINLYPDNQKVPDALYKLGVVYHRLGDVDRAREYLTRVGDEYPQSSAAGLAQTYLAEL